MTEIRVDNEITLRTITPDDARAVYELVDTDRERLRWIPPLAGLESVEEESRWIDSSLASDDGNVGFLIVVEGQIAGGIGQHPSDENGNVNIGYWLGSQYEGRGVVTRSCVALIDRIFASGVAKSVMIRAGKGNSRSRAVAERLGFSPVESPIKTMELVNGPTEMVAYLMLATDWPGPADHARDSVPRR